MRAWKLMSVLLGLAFVGMQFVPIAPRRESVTETHIVGMTDPQVAPILNRACRDCHSANTRWPWYSRVAPVSWMVSRDVRRGRAKLDFSQWSGRFHSDNERMEICDAVSNGAMPVKMYTLVHRDARLTEQDVDRICDWAASQNASASARQPGAGVATPRPANSPRAQEKIR